MIKTKILDDYNGYGKVLCIENGAVELFVTVDLGPRIIRYALKGGQNVLRDTPDFDGPHTGEDYENLWGKGKAWLNMGGHRIWATPEVFPETYSPDDVPVEYEITENGAIFTKEPEVTGIRKQLEVLMDKDDSNVTVINRVKNVSGKDMEFATWSITVAAPGGKVIAKMNDRDTAPNLNRVITVWPYTDLSDERIKFFDKYFTLTQKDGFARPIKLGFDIDCGTVFYVLGEDTFIKSFGGTNDGNTYPDNGCNFETYTDTGMIEVESLSPQKTVKDTEILTQTEHWSLVKTPTNCNLETQDGIDEFMKKI